MKRNRYTPEFKSQIVLEVLKEEKTMSEIASSHGIHVNQIRQWRNAFLEQMPLIFAKENKKVDQIKADYENQIENLYAEVGRLTTQLSWLKKKIWNQGVGPNVFKWLIGMIKSCHSLPRLICLGSIVLACIISPSSLLLRKYLSSTRLMKFIPSIPILDPGE